MARKSSTGFEENRCPRCRLLRELCFCAGIPRLDTRTRVVFVVHYLEQLKSSNSARWAHLALSNSEWRVRGEKGVRREHHDLTHAVVLFPSDDARELTEEFARSLPRPLTLVVPDGSWRQARKAFRREPGLEALPRVKLPYDGPSRYRLRTPPRSDGVSTLEAVARAMGVLEGRWVREALEAAFEQCVLRSLWARGKLGRDALPGSGDILAAPSLSF